MYPQSVQSITTSKALSGAVLWVLLPATEGKLEARLQLRTHHNQPFATQSKLRETTTCSEEENPPETASTATTARANSAIFRATAPLQLRAVDTRRTVAPYPSVGSNTSTELYDPKQAPPPLSEHWRNDRTLEARRGSRQDAAHIPGQTVLGGART